MKIGNTSIHCFTAFFTSESHRISLFPDKRIRGF